ncbi:ABC transporter ATP-binding protein [Desulfopila sp. IMCC35008]|uniref:ABC transporter ATP-binding protein n=1 Tax=Desulfopila sp. IMCC35008 TaxID=2653858 RepID=UPI0013D719F3|nr:ABC transporter ATP-binding protein [Desulfopila sp. IMCC35008]
MILTAEKISRHFVIGERQVQALDTVTLSVSAGAFLVITGPSGSGKSTLLNLLSGFDKPSTGSVCFHGRGLETLGNREAALLRNKAFGFIYQTPHLLADKTVLENVKLPFHYGEWCDQDAVTDRCLELLEYVGLSDLTDRYPSTLSGGEMQRVVFARALAREPEIIFADEPTGSLDAMNAEKILKMLREQTEMGRSVIMVTHDNDAIQFGSSQLVLRKSRLVEKGRCITGN